MRICLFLITIFLTHQCFSQTSSTRKLIPVSLMVSGVIVDPGSIRLYLSPGSTNLMLDTKIERVGKANFYSIGLNATDTVANVSVVLAPISLGYVLGSMPLDSILNATKMEVQLDKIFFKEALAMGLSWTNLHVIAQVRFYHHDRLIMNFFYSVKREFWPKPVRKILRKAKILEGKFVQDPKTGKTNLIILGIKSRRSKS